MSNFENAKVQVKQGWLQGYVEENVKIFKGSGFGDYYITLVIKFKSLS